MIFGDMLFTLDRTRSVRPDGFAILNVVSGSGHLVAHPFAVLK